MPEHVHLLLSEPKQQLLSNTMRVLKGETSKRLKGDRKQFWQTRYHDFNVLTHRNTSRNSGTSTATPYNAASSTSPKTGHGAAIATISPANQVE